MSGVEERPVKRKEIYVKDLLADLHRTMDNQDGLRMVWKFGVFDKFTVAMGLFWLIFSVLLLIPPVEALESATVNFGIPFGAICVGMGCVKREWQR